MASNPPSEVADDAHVPQLELEWVHEAQALVAVHVHGTVTDAVWETYVDAVRSNLKPGLRCFVWNEGGRPTIAQQRRLVEVTRGIPVPVAVVSSMIAVRFIVSAFSLANRNIRFFSAPEVGAALDYLCSDPVWRAMVRDAVMRAAARAGIAPGLGIA